MDVRETTKLCKALEGILQNVNDVAKRGVAIGQYLYQAKNDIASDAEVPATLKPMT